MTINNNQERTNIVITFLIFLIFTIFLPNFVLFAATATIISEADAFTSQGFPNNYASNPLLMNNGGYGGISIRVAGNGYDSLGYIKFNLAGIPANSISSAILRVYSPRAFASSLVVNQLTNDSWTEAGITWNNAPVAGSSLGTIAISAGWLELDVTSYVKSRTTDVSFQFSLFSTQYETFYFISREGRTDWRPQLVVTHSSSVVPPAEENYWADTTSLLALNTIWLVHNSVWTNYTSIGLQVAINAAVAGDEVVLGPGRYYQTANIGVSGTLGNPIIIRGDGTPKPILDASGLTSISAYGRGMIGIGPDNSSRANYITIRNLEICNASAVCGFVNDASSIYINVASNSIIENCYLHHNGNGLAATYNSNGLLIQYNDIGYNSYVGAGYEHGLYIESGGTTTTQYNHIHHNGGNGYKDRGGYTELLYNYIHDSGNYEVDLVDPDASLIGPFNALVLGNIIKKASSSTQSDFIILFGEDRHGGVGTFNNNTIIAGESGNAFIALWDRYSTNADNIVMNNNIFYANGFNSLSIIDPYHDMRLTGTNNWIQSDSINTGSLINSVLGITPGFIDASSGNYHLLNNSACLDAADNTVYPLPFKEYVYPFTYASRSVNGNLDIGAYEFRIDSPAISQDNVGGGGGGGGGCFIASAAYGGYQAKEVKLLVSFRNKVLAKSYIGNKFINFYYNVSPQISKFISRRNWAKTVVRILLRPVVFVARIVLSQVS